VYRIGIGIGIVLVSEVSVKGGIGAPLIPALVKTVAEELGPQRSTKWYQVMVIGSPQKTRPGSALSGM